MGEDRETAVRRAEFEYERAMADIRNFKAGKNGAGLEARYGQAYQRLVDLGLKPQLKLKYRRA